MVYRRYFYRSFRRSITSRPSLKHQQINLPGNANDRCTHNDALNGHSFSCTHQYRTCSIHGTCSTIDLCGPRAGSKALSTPTNPARSRSSVYSICRPRRRPLKNTRVMVLDTLTENNNQFYLQPILSRVSTRPIEYHIHFHTGVHHVHAATSRHVLARHRSHLVHHPVGL